MAISCEINSLTSAAKCFSCLNRATLREISTYLLCQWANGLTPQIPNAPENLDILDASTAVNVKVRWTAPGSGPVPTSYDVYRSDNGAAFVLIANVPTPNLNDLTGGFIDGHVWTYKIKSVIGANTSAFSATVSIGKNLNFDNTGAVAVSYSDLIVCIGDLTYTNQAAMVSFSAPRLRTVLGGFALHTSPLCAAVTITAFKTAGTYFQISLDGLTAVNLDNLQTVGIFVITGSGIIALSLPALTTCPGDFAFDSCPALISVSIPVLTSVQNLIGDASTVLTTVIATVFASTTSNFTFNGCSALLTLSFPQLVSVAGALVLASSGLTGFSFTNLINVGSIDASASSALNSVDMPNVVFPDASITISFDSCALDATSVNQILARGVASAPSTDDFELANGTNAAPSGQGVADKFTLSVVLGNTVNTN